MTRKCKQCQGVHILTSRWRWVDIPALLLLLRPIRCAYCGKRQYADRIPVVGGLARVAAIGLVLMMSGAMLYTRTTGQPLEPLQLLKIGVSKVFHPEEDAAQPITRNTSDLK